MTAGMPDPLALARSRAYVRLLVLAAILGVPIAGLAYGFLALVSESQDWVYADLPDALGLDPVPRWWPLLPLTAAGLLVGLAVTRLPGRGGHVPIDGFQASGGPAPPAALPGIAIAALAGLALGAVVGPEAPLIALGGGLAAAIVHLRPQEAPGRTAAALGATGSFAAVSTLLGSPLVGAVLMLEAVGLGGQMAAVVLVPGLLASGIGYLIFIGLDGLTGLGTFSLALPDLASVGEVRGSWIAWAVVIGLGAAALVGIVRRIALLMRPVVEGRVVLMTTLAGALVALIAIAYGAVTDQPAADVLFSGEDALPALVAAPDSRTTGALLLLVACKGLAWAICLASFRGGPVFPAMFLGAVGGILLAELPGLPVTVGVGAGIGAMVCAMLRMPVTSVLLVGVFMADAGVELYPPVIVAVVVAYAASAWLAPRPATPAAATSRSDDAAPSRTAG